MSGCDKPSAGARRRRDRPSKEKRVGQDMNSDKRKGRDKDRSRLRKGPCAWLTLHASCRPSRS